MDFCIADTFVDSLARLSGHEQKAVKTTAFDLQLNPSNPGNHFHKLDRAKDKNFWSVRVNADIRLIVHRTAGCLLLCYVDHHDKAYAWAERRRLETHPNTGAAQLVELRETVQQIVVPVTVSQAPTAAPKPALFADCSDDELLGYGVPREWLSDIKRADEESLLALADRLPAEAAEALLELATGGKPSHVPLMFANLAESHELPSLANYAEIPALRSDAIQGMDHPDAQRRFRVINSIEELERALEFPWDKWTVFLHPEQRALVERTYSGPARVSGSAGTGKTIVALHRAAHLARSKPDARVLLVTFSDTLARALQMRLRRLVSNEPRLADRIDVGSLNAVGLRLHKAICGPLKLATVQELRQILGAAASDVGGHKFGQHFLLTEWDQVVDAWQLRSWESYRDFVRLGRKTRLPESQRKVAWSIFESAMGTLSEKRLSTVASMFDALAKALPGQRNAPYEFIVVDEAQDISPLQLRFLAALGGTRSDALFFAGDLGQRIFQAPFSWKALGVDIRGRARTLRVNYRTSHQIRKQADRLLDPEIKDVDGNVDQRGDTVSVFNGPMPLIQTFGDVVAESKAVSDWLAGAVADGVQPHEIGVFVRSDTEMPRALKALKAAGLPCKVLDEQVESTSGFACASTMHLAKGLEFRAVAVMACDDEVLPLQQRIQEVGDDGDLRDVYDTERHLLYVACTRARDRLLVTGMEPASEFLEDLLQG